MDKLCSILEEAQNIADPSDFDFGIKEDSLDFNMSAYIEPVSLNACKPVAHKAGKTAKKRTWKKPKDKPKRPLSAYNLFFQHEREKIISSIPDDKSTVSVDDNLSEEAKRRRHRKTHGKIGFAALARSIADKWKKIDDSSRSVFEARAEVEKQRYKKELDAWMKLKKERGESTKSKKKSKPAVTVAQKIAPPSGPKSLASLMKTGAELRKQVLQQMLAQQQQQQQNQQQPHHNKKAADPPQCWIRETEITEKDVICERGGKSNRHAGTKRYRGMIERYKKEYQQLTAKADKTNLSRSLIAQIQKNGGRFLKKDEDTNQYFVLSAVETTKKVSQALREKKVLKWTET
mmetsp:Transcript_17048/g.28946  ORF Transcript_17048/g.28946 Transcript_17048/m.28946 type:complete len:346 (-) Transcript_17048:102-1139(-)